MKVFWSPQYNSPAQEFETHRKSQWIAESLRTKPIDGVELVEPLPIDWDNPYLRMAHAAEYIDAVRTGEPRHLAESNGFRWNPDLPVMVAASTGGVLAAVDSALDDGISGSLSSGLHHATYHEGNAFCTFNGLVIGALYAVHHHGFKRVAILDFDAHCGGGTQSILDIVDDGCHVGHFDLSTNGFDSYSKRDVCQGLLQISKSRRYEIEYFLMLEQLKAWNPALVIYNAGMDPIGDGVGGETLGRREVDVFEMARDGFPVAFVLAGGYLGRDVDQGGLVGLHRLTIQSAALVTEDESSGRP